MDGIRSDSRSLRHQPQSFSRKPVVYRQETPLVSRRITENIPVSDSSTLLLKRQSVFAVYWEKLKYYYAQRYASLISFKGSRYFYIPFFSSPKNTLYFALAGGVAFGVFLTAFSFIVFDRGVSAHAELVREPLSSVAPQGSVDSAVNTDDAMTTDEDVFLEYFNEAAEEEYRAKITEMVKGYPIEPMLPYIFTKDRTVAAFLIGIAKKESNWGKRVPVLEGQDCFNYWGYRGVRRLMGTGGHTCFNSRKDAVDSVAKRIDKLVYSEKLDTPEKMVLWKCGFSCQGHSRESVKKWISDVSMYFSQLDMGSDE